jgi:hypothetical protein
MVQQYVKFFYPGSFFSEESVKKINNRTDKIDVPKNAFAYEFFEKSEIEQDGEVLTGFPRNISGRYYIGELYDLERVKKEFPDKDVLIRNMESNDWTHVVKCSQGMVPFDTKKDIVINKDN